MNEHNLQIEMAENGFVVTSGHISSNYPGKRWAFESAETLSKFILEWGQGNERAEATTEIGN